MRALRRRDPPVRALIRRQDPPSAALAGAERVEADMRDAAVLAAAGFRVTRWDDVTPLAAAWLAARRQAAAPALSLGLVMRPRMAGMVAHDARNLQDGRVTLVMGVATAA
ncbi:hypothetical protein [Paracraurococcus ruber]|uniref:Uncharacterized protein n=1 Tax=Paracraurococcus ruber TaxID=77675 RepID=A0ABS1D5S6_9PROT|nr:hypothetical protein [Paracraurococcus ruber]MBK1661848.1 hypothetical protein [Paracraurococcus ruber]TDG17270.1 hypothetical protein E2C05_28675 [Paracraurococcus ruber]